MDDTILFIAHSTITNTDIGSVNGQGPWGYGEGAVNSAPPAPAGTYVIHVRMAHPERNMCKWHMQIWQS